MDKVLGQIGVSLKSIISKLERYERGQGGRIYQRGADGAVRTGVSDLRSEVLDIYSLVEFVSSLGISDLGVDIGAYVEKLNEVNNELLPMLFGDDMPGVLPLIRDIMHGLRRVINSILVESGSERLAVILKKVGDADVRLAGFGSKLADIEKRVLGIEDRSRIVGKSIRDFGDFYKAKDGVVEAVERMKGDGKIISDLKLSAEGVLERLKSVEREAAGVLENCEKAYSAATSFGLASAFDERSKSLGVSMWLWVLGLVVSLFIGWYFGGGQVHSLLNVVNSHDASLSVVFLNILLSALSIGAPIWFAWLSTKQIGQRFRLSEDYAFKASISRAYEGYRREAARIGGSDMEEKLLASALSRLDELPLRLVETPSYGSPLHELLSSDSVKKALGTAPGFVDDVKSMAKRKLNTSTSFKSASDANTQQSS
ncbi:hypothetical protein PPG32_01125 [Lautropia mirabilis]|uniref:hypothetical protein n=1 Tax=Lautropia mirabilis TaxID=47671 RepID=UPI00234BE12D|nr:hypothetical protein [Lautropia mirabilis]MDC6092723.1 hypothetical protein [Lautropia mirabilis]